MTTPGLLRCRSIPARAGEPPIPARLDGLPAVYPRACGGTPTSSALWLLLEGLSPRVRGNPLSRYLPDVASGSIPARAGEPAEDDRNNPQRKVYPRACGGT